MIVDLSFLGNKDVIVSALKSGDLHFWNVNTGRTVHYFPADLNITAIAFSKKNEYLAMGFLDGSFSVHDQNNKYQKIFSGNLSKLQYENQKAIVVSNSGKKGIFAILKKNDLKNNKIYKIKFYDKKNFFMLSHRCRLRLFNIDTLKCRQKYKIREGSKQVP